MPLLILVAGIVSLAAAVLVRQRYLAVRVEGTSMSPTYAPGEVVLVRRGHRGLRVGDVVVVERPPVEADGPGPTGQRWLIKRVAAVGGDPVPAAVTGYGTVVPPGMIVVLGDSPVRGFDSRSVGFLAVERVLGVARHPRPVQHPLEPTTGRSTGNERGPR
jgi:signal peptidase I